MPTTPTFQPPPAPVDARTMLELFHDRVEKLGGRPAFFRKVAGRWEPVLWRDYGNQVRRFAKGLSRLGVEKGQGVCILGFNRLEWVVADLAAMAIGAVPAGIYTTSSPEQAAYIVEHCEATVAVVENAAQLAKLKAVKDRLSRLRWVVLMDRDPESEKLPWVRTFEQVLAEGDAGDDRVYFERVKALEPAALATLIYTSGTTGPPKGVMLSHQNLLWTARHLTDSMGIPGEERVISYLPLSHIAEQLSTIHCAIYAGVQVYFAESMEKIKDHLAEVRPTLFLGVPRVWEKLKAGIEAKVAEAPPRRQMIFRRALAVGKAYYLARQAKVPAPVLVALQHRIFQRLVYRKLKERLGLDQARAGITAAAPIGKDVLEFFWALDLPILEVYGQSEGSGPTSLNRENDYRVGTVGKPLDGVEVRLDEDGEILVRGGNVFLGYYKDEAATKETLTPDGWLRSGDVGQFDPAGFLRITDRKKELIVTSGGKKTGPATLEAVLKSLPPVGQAVVIGDNRKYLSAILTLEPAAAETWAQKHGIPWRGIAELSKEPRLREHLQKEIDEKLNAQVAKFETIKRFTILPVDFEIGEDGELTPTMKLRRKVIARKWSAEIEKLYAAEASSAA